LAEKSSVNEDLMDRSTKAEEDNSLYPIVQIWVRHGLLNKVQGLKLESACLSNGNNLIAGLASLGFINTEPFIQAVAEEITTLLPKESHLKSAILTNGLNGKSNEGWHLEGNDQTDQFKEMICSAEDDSEYALALQIAISEWIKKLKGEGTTEHKPLLTQLRQVFYALQDGDLEGALRRLTDKGKREEVMSGT
jgi:hypothetical protein